MEECSAEEEVIDIDFNEDDFKKLLNLEDEGMIINENGIDDSSPSPAAMDVDEHEEGIVLKTIKNNFEEKDLDRKVICNDTSLIMIVSNTPTIKVKIDLDQRKTDSSISDNSINDNEKETKCDLPVPTLGNIKSRLSPLINKQLQAEEDKQSEGCVEEKQDQLANNEVDEDLNNIVSGIFSKIKIINQKERKLPNESDVCEFLMKSRQNHTLENRSVEDCEPVRKVVSCKTDLIMTVPNNCNNEVKPPKYFRKNKDKSRSRSPKKGRQRYSNSPRRQSISPRRSNSGYLSKRKQSRSRSPKYKRSPKRVSAAVVRRRSKSPRQRSRSRSPRNNVPSWKQKSSSYYNSSSKKQDCSPKLKLNSSKIVFPKQTKINSKNKISFKIKSSTRKLPINKKKILKSRSPSSGSDENDNSKDKTPADQTPTINKEAILSELHLIDSLLKKKKECKNDVPQIQSPQRSSSNQELFQEINIDIPKTPQPPNISEPTEMNNTSDEEDIPFNLTAPKNGKINSECVNSKKLIVYLNNYMTALLRANKLQKQPTYHNNKIDELPELVLNVFHFFKSCKQEEARYRQLYQLKYIEAKSRELMKQQEDERRLKYIAGGDTSKSGVKKSTPVRLGLNARNVLKSSKSIDEPEEEIYYPFQTIDLPEDSNPIFQKIQQVLASDISNYDNKWNRGRFIVNLEDDNDFWNKTKRKAEDISNETSNCKTDTEPAFFLFKNDKAAISTVKRYTKDTKTLMFDQDIQCDIISDNDKKLSDIQSELEFCKKHLKVTEDKYRNIYKTLASMTSHMLNYKMNKTIITKLEQYNINLQQNVRDLQKQLEISESQKAKVERENFVLKWIRPKEFFIN